MLEIEFTFPAWAEIIKANEDRINLFQAATIQFNRAMIFDNEGAYNGRKKWAPLKFRNGQILTKTGTLRKSIGPVRGGGMPGQDGIVRILEDQIIVGTKLGYARMMNDGTTKMPGGVLRATKAKALKIPLPQGKQATDIAKELSRGSIAAKVSALREKRDRAISPTTEKKYQDKIDRLQVKVRNNESGPDKFIFRKTVRIPARPFDDWNEQDQEEFDTALLNLITEILNGKN